MSVNCHSSRLVSSCLTTHSTNFQLLVYSEHPDQPSYYNILICILFVLRNQKDFLSHSLSFSFLKYKHEQCINMYNSQLSTATPIIPIFQSYNMCQLVARSTGNIYSVKICCHVRGMSGNSASTYPHRHLIYIVTQGLNLILKQSLCIGLMIFHLTLHLQLFNNIMNFLWLP